MCIHIYICSYSSLDERIQRKKSAQYRRRRAITVKVTLTSPEVSVTLTMCSYMYMCYLNKVFYMTTYICSCT